MNKLIHLMDGNPLANSNILIIFIKFPNLILKFLAVLYVTEYVSLQKLKKRFYFRNR